MMSPLWHFKKKNNADENDRLHSINEQTQIYYLLHNYGLFKINTE